MALNRSPLGKGLAALLGDANISYAQQAPQSIEITKIQPGLNQPRQEFSVDELADLTLSIQRKGILQPLLVRKIEQDKFEIIAGERRWRAANQAKLDRVPVVIITCNDQEALEIGLIENLQRHDLNPIEEAEAIKRLQAEFSLTQEQIANSIGKSRSYVANMIRLTSLSQDIKILIRQNRLSAGHARAIITAENPDALVEQILSQKLNVRDVEKLAKQKKVPHASNTNEKNAISNTIDTDVQVIIELLEKTLGMKVDLNVKGEEGNLVIHFKKLSQLDQLLNRLQQ